MPSRIVFIVTLLRSAVCQHTTNTPMTLRRPESLQRPDCDRSTDSNASHEPPGRTSVAAATNAGQECRRNGKAHQGSPSIAAFEPKGGPDSLLASNSPNR